MSTTPEHLGHEIKTSQYGVITQRSVCNKTACVLKKGDHKCTGREWSEGSANLNRTDGSKNTVLRTAQDPLTRIKKGRLGIYIARIWQVDLKEYVIFGGIQTSMPSLMVQRRRGNYRRERMGEAMGKKWGRRAAGEINMILPQISETESTQKTKFKSRGVTDLGSVKAIAII